MTDLSRQYHDAIARTAGVLSHWPLDEAAGFFRDEVGGLAGDIRGAPTARAAASILPAGQGAALVLAGGGNYVEIGDAYDFAGAVPYTVEAWARNDSAAGADRGLVAKRTATDGYLGLWLSIANLGLATWRFNAGANATLNAAGVWAAGAVHHVASTFDGSRFRLYVDGVLVNTSAAPLVNAASIAATSRPLGLGGDPTGVGTGTNGWLGALQHVAIYDGALDVPTLMHHRRIGAGLELLPAADDRRRFTPIGGLPASIDGSVRTTLGGLLDLGDAVARGGVITADPDTIAGLRDVGIFTETAA